MKTKITNSNLLVIIAVAAVVGFQTGNADAQTKSTKSMLTAAGFRARTPQTEKQREIYASLPSNKVERTTVKGKTYYVFKDKASGVAYVGGEPEHQQYLKLCRQRHFATAHEEEMTHPLARRWNQWGPGPE